MNSSPSRGWGRGDNAGAKESSELGVSWGGGVTIRSREETIAELRKRGDKGRRG